MAFRYDQRPTICPDKNCHFLCSDFDSKTFEDGYSFECFGQLEEPNVVKWNASVHENNLCHCIYTPFKGLIKYLANKEDLELGVKMYNMALEKLQEKVPVVRRV